MGCCNDCLTCDIAFNAVMSLSRASTRGSYSRIEGVTARRRRHRHTHHLEPGDGAVDVINIYAQHSLGANGTSSIATEVPASGRADG